MSQPRIVELTVFLSALLLLGCSASKSSSVAASTGSSRDGELRVPENARIPLEIRDDAMVVGELKAPEKMPSVQLEAPPGGLNANLAVPDGMTIGLEPPDEMPSVKLEAPNGSISAELVVPDGARIGLEGPNEPIRARLEIDGPIELKAPDVMPTVQLAVPADALRIALDTKEIALRLPEDSLATEVKLVVPPLKLDQDAAIAVDWGTPPVVTNWNLDFKWWSRLLTIALVLVAAGGLGGLVKRWFERKLGRDDLPEEVGWRADLRNAWLGMGVAVSLPTALYVFEHVYGLPYPKLMRGLLEQVDEKSIYVMVLAGIAFALALVSDVFFSVILGAFHSGVSTVRAKFEMPGPSDAEELYDSMVKRERGQVSARGNEAGRDDGESRARETATRPRIGAAVDRPAGDGNRRLWPVKIALMGGDYFFGYLERSEYGDWEMTARDETTPAPK